MKRKEIKDLEERNKYLEQRNQYLEDIFKNMVISLPESTKSTMKRAKPELQETVAHE
ncbi:hypothetical protein [Vibrio vulnificus]|uniref:hypothetical protein n=1 Tax=Vibrio vulnificus TaxID=672 RepID=UPI003242C1BC